MTTLKRIQLWARFRAAGPWITRFTIDERIYGGWYEAATDPRLQWFSEAFPHASRVLELGALEGGHTLGLSRLPHVQKLVAIEGRSDNLRRARLVQNLLNFPAEFLQADLEQFDLRTLGKFDAVFCCGLLYHLPQPWELVSRIAEVTDQLFLSTHFTLKNPAPISANGYPGEWIGEHGLRDPLSGLSRQSFWPTLPGLHAILLSTGLEVRKTFATEADHPNGPLVTLAATKTKL